MWQKRLRLAIALFVVVFAAVVVVSLRRGHNQRVASVPPARSDPKATVENRGGGVYERSEEGKLTFSLKFGRSVTYADGRTKLSSGVEVVLPDKAGRRVSITAGEAIVMNPPDKGLANAEFEKNVKLTTSDGLTVMSDRATYDEKEGIARVPGAVKFSKGRMTGSGTGATYDRNRDVLWILDAANVDVTADEKGGGAMHITSKAAGLARQEHYVKFTGGARMEGEGRVTVADEATAFTTPDDERVTRMELRGNARITGSASGSGPQSMQGRDIDLTYAEDGRTLQFAKLIENASAELPGDAGKPGRRVSGRTIDISLAPDGSTVTNLTANENVEVDLPPDGDLPSRRIRAAALVATGAPGSGLQNAAFTGNVEYRESRAARRGVDAIERTARSLRLDVQTKPGFGDIERAEFHGNVHFTDGAKTTADAPLAIYSIKDDRLDLSPSATGDPGAGPHVSDGRINVDARTIQMVLGPQKMTAETKVRSLMQPQSRGGAPAKEGAAPAKPGQLPPVAPVAAAAQPPTPQGTGSASAGQPPARIEKTPQGNVPAAAAEPPARGEPPPQGNAPAAAGQPPARGEPSPQGNAPAAAGQPPARGEPSPQGNAPAAAGQPPARTENDVKMPAMLKQNEPVTVTANRLAYDGASSLATYTGNARLWQEETEVRADTIILDDKNGNLRANTNVRTMMSLKPNEESAKTTKPKTKPAPPEPTITVADALVYDDARRRATYTTKAHMSGPDGDVTADKIDLYLTESGGELERAEAFGNVISRDNTRRAYGSHLTYISAKEEYTMVGTPVEVYDDTAPDCKLTKGTTLTFHKSVDTITARGNDISSTQTKSIACGTAGPSSKTGTEPR